MPAEQPEIERLGRMIKTAREALGWSQPDLARKADVSRPTVQRYENAKSPNLEPDKLLRIFQVLKLDRREIPVILGLVTREEMGLPPEPVRILSPATQQIIDLLEGDDMSAAEKQALIDLLRARRRRPPEEPPASRRKAG